MAKKETQPDETTAADEAVDIEADDQKPSEETDQPQNNSYSVPDAPEVQKTDKYTLPLEEAGKQSAVTRGMGRTMMIALLAIVIAILGVAVVWLTHDDPVTPAATENDTTTPAQLGAAATFIEGVAEMHTGDENWVEIDSAVTLAEGNTIRTGSSSRLVITIDDGSAVRLNSNSEATLKMLNSESVQIVNSTGEIYTRVVASDSREFTVEVGDTNYQAIGTAYKTSNTDDVTGVDVFHSTVKSGDTMIGEGKAYFTKHTDENKVNKISDINLDALKDDEFIKWNAELDKKESDFADKLGILDGIDNEDDKKEEEPETSPSPTAGIVASASKTSSGVKVSWTANGINTQDGFKVVYSKSKSSPVYGTDASHYVGNKDATSAFIELTDGKKYNIRVCAYRPDQGTCTDYSNTVSVTAPVVELDPVVSGTVEAELSGDVLEWSFAGTAPHGFKIVANTGGEPVYPNHSIAFTAGTSKDLSKLELADGTYKFRVCKWTNNTQEEQCIDYSNEIEYVVN